MGRIGVRTIRSEFANEKFLKEIGGGSCANPEGRVFERQARPAIFRRIVGVGDAAGGETSEDTRVIWLPVSIVALTDDGIGDGIKKPRSLTAGALVEIARILFQDRGEYRAANESA